MQIETFCGGMAGTNGYMVETREGTVVIDAPQGLAEELARRKVRVKALVLTHGHWDHIWDAAAVVESAGCPVYGHRADDLLLAHPDKQLALFGLPPVVPPVRLTHPLEGGDSLELGEWTFRVFHIPGHCPGSICLYAESAGVVFGGDVLFRGGVGRTDLPFGSAEQLFAGIRTHLYTLPDEVRVYPGHGEPTTIGEEKRGNPFVRG
jgi:glyoxylase-like metal-dependent hydrolase (beta-lactamase superfamily II)